MKTYSVIWTDIASDSVIDIVSGFADHQGKQAEKIIEEIFDAGYNLATFPLRGRIIPELRDMGEHNIREIFYKPWRIIYETHPNSVAILLVIDGRRDCDEALRELLLRNKFSS